MITPETLALLDELLSEGWRLGPIWDAYRRGVLSEEPRGKTLLRHSIRDVVAIVKDTGEWEVCRCGVLPSLRPNGSIDPGRVPVIIAEGVGDIEESLRRVREAFAAVNESDPATLR